MFHSIKNLCAAASIAVISATGASAALLDFTEGLPGATSGSLGAGVNWQLSAVGGTVRTDFAYDGGDFFKNGVGAAVGLKLDNDGVGVAKTDEVTGPSEELHLTFSKAIFLQAVHFLDLYIGTATESALTYDANTNTLLVETFATGNFAGYASKSIADVAVSKIKFVPGVGRDDGSADFSLAAIEYRTKDGQVDVVPLPAGALLLVTGLGGLAAMRRRKKA